MSDSQKPGSADDPWEQLAEDLFGLEYGKEHAAREPDAPVPSEVIASEEPAPRPPEPVAPEREPVPERELVGEREPVSEAEATADAEFVFDEAEEVSESTESGPAEPARTEPVSPQDSYWDALANWNWDESEGGKGKQAESRSSDRPAHRGGSRGRDEGRGRRGGERPQRQAPSPPTPGPAAAAHRPSRASVPSAPDDFGSGVVTPEPGATPPAESASEPPPGRETREHAEPARPPAETTGGGHFDRGRQGPRGHGEERDEGHRKRRRRRRRRRSRGEAGERGPAPATDSTIPGADWEDEGPAGSESTAEETTEGFGHEQSALADRRERDWENEQPSGQSENIEEPFADDDEAPQEVAAVGGAEDEPDLEDDGDDGDDGSEEQTVGYDNVPTWEEAISYLLHPSQVQVEGGSGSGGPPPRSSAPGDQPRQTRHVGHRKHRR